MNVKITPSIAESLFVAIATDTGFFRHTNTSPTTFEVCVDLMKNGVELERISNNIHYNRTENGYKLLARVLETLTIKDKFGYAVVSQDMFEQTNTTMEETDDFINYVRSIEGVKVAAIFKEHNDGKIKVSMRSNSDFDVNKFAAIFGGGGHPKAAGFSFEGSLQECIERVVAEMDKAG
ncbi:hypothetical protein KKC59_02540 [bacterium]|nr:hypothetical protein [bacterium]